MKFQQLYISLFLGTIVNSANAFSIPSSSTFLPGSATSAFTAYSQNVAHSSKSHLSYSNKGDNMLMYEPGNDPPNRKSIGSNADGSGIWSALANTERWITKTLGETNRAAAPGQPAGSNPYARKEVSYVCETNDEALMIIAGIFRRVKEARVLGESHSQAEEAIILDKGPDYSPSTLRQTQVIVMPWCPTFKAFHAFEAAIQAVNASRRAARDFVTDVEIEKREMRRKGEHVDRDWSVGINVASLHPKYGEKSPKEILAEMKKAEEEGEPEIDLNMKEYVEKKNRARQSPYPTIVLEVKAMPPPDFGNSPPPSVAEDTASSGETAEEKGSVSKADLEKLEALFGKSAAIKETKESKRNEESFFDSLGSVPGIEEISAVNPISSAQEWISKNDPFYDRKKSTLCVTDAKHVDAAYEVVFTNLAMQKQASSSPENPSITPTSKKEEDKFSSLLPPMPPLRRKSSTVKEFKLGKRSYVMMPNFLTSSATSFEKFTYEVTKIIGSIKGMSDHVSVSTLHPEHVLKERRSPLPVFVIQWYDEVSN